MLYTNSQTALYDEPNQNTLAKIPGNEAKSGYVTQSDKNLGNQFTLQPS